MFSFNRLWLLLALTLPTVSAGADIYKYFDSDGNLVLSDEVPKDNADKVERIKARPVMTVPAVVPPSRGARARPADAAPAGEPETVSAKKVEAAPDYRIRVTSPVAEETYLRGGDPIPVGVGVNPGLKSGHRLELRLDGRVADSLVAIDPGQLDRGEHRLTVRVLGADGKPLASAIVPFHIQQRSAIKPGVKAGK